MAASVPAKPTEIGARLDDALARYVVRRRASYGTTRAAVETYRIEVEKPEISSHLSARHRAKSLPALPKVLPRGARVLPSVARPGARAPPTHQPPKPDQWWESIPSP